MFNRLTFGALFVACMVLSSPAVAVHDVAPTPPMGWNSWDAYGLTIDEAQYKANAAVLASLKRYGWSYAVIDEGWYMADPSGDKRQTRDYQLDSEGRLIPAVGRFPSAAAGEGFKPLAEWVHRRGLKFGIHIVRGIPKQAVEENLPIAGSDFRAADAADTSDTCGWDDGNYGVRDNAAGQAYYDSMIQLYAKWGVDFLKVDCIADHPYKAGEIRQIAEAIKKVGRPIVLSLSPGPTQLQHATEIAKYAQMWRISNDIWDGWHFPVNPKTDGFPSGIDTAFDHLAEWNPYVGAGHWPDADMLPFGSLTPKPGWGEPRHSRLSDEEMRTQFALWAIARSPLILGANLTRLDDAARLVITNRRIIAINQTAEESRPISALPTGFENVRAWRATAMEAGAPVQYVALFNIDDKPATLNVTWNQLGYPGSHSTLDLWTGTKRQAASSFTVTLPAHGSVVYRLD